MTYLRYIIYLSGELDRFSSNMLLKSSRDGLGWKSSSSFNSNIAPDFSTLTAGSYVLSTLTSDSDFDVSVPSTPTLNSNSMFFQFFFTPFDTLLQIWLRSTDINYRVIQTSSHTWHKYSLRSDIKSSWASNKNIGDLNVSEEHFVSGDYIGVSCRLDDWKKNENEYMHNVKIFSLLK